MRRQLINYILDIVEQETIIEQQRIALCCCSDFEPLKFYQYMVSNENISLNYLEFLKVVLPKTNQYLKELVLIRYLSQNISISQDCLDLYRSIGSLNLQQFNIPAAFGLFNQSTEIGYLTIDSIVELSDQETTISYQQALVIMQLLDADNDKRITYDEFTQLFRGSSESQLTIDQTKADIPIQVPKQQQIHIISFRNTEQQNLQPEVQQFTIDDQSTNQLEVNVPTQVQYLESGQSKSNQYPQLLDSTQTVEKLVNSEQIQYKTETSTISQSSYYVRHQKFKHIEQSNLARLLKQFIVQQRLLMDAKNTCILQPDYTWNTIGGLFGNHTNSEQFNRNLHKLGIDYDKDLADKLFDQFDSHHKKYLDESDYKLLLFPIVNDFNLLLEQRQVQDLEISNETYQEVSKLMNLHLRVQQQMRNTWKNNQFNIQQAFYHISQNSASISCEQLKYYLQMHNLSCTKVELQLLMNVFASNRDNRICISDFQERLQ